MVAMIFTGKLPSIAAASPIPLQTLPVAVSRCSTTNTKSNSPLILPLLLNPKKLVGSPSRASVSRFLRADLIPLKAAKLFAFDDIVSEPSEQRIFQAVKVTDLGGVYLARVSRSLCVRSENVTGTSMSATAPNAISIDLSGVYV
ncbi:hypothetical protein C5C66_02385 [Rathayibacter toxicus]|uniref:Uncharacterized protein n=1 Tax=Rathayibacter toxicus TaxID=145458 RepID=A0A0C5B8L9_9MICO|nr:hypothetical protein TI83_02575 [Rathayibacter toxicus]ALS57015.1 hypothetical protein APU90_03895 [Rathayibacter toxicus]KKM46157.1 hypothetical protein VT73_03600 [Rathayibacter toxicus]PPG47692.1 hypothetical protein C5D16_02355 [Rathayibacter toxicus]PPH24834.1 hypothetical protein C5D17_02340 [Rathayibacter toxicus]